MVFRSIWSMVHEISIIICDRIRERKLHREILIQITVWSLLHMIDFGHDSYALDRVYLFTIIQTVILFGLEYWKSLNRKFEVDR